MTEACAALARLDQACRQLADPELLIRPALWREALDSSALEGTYGSLPELLEAQLPSSLFASPEMTEIRAYERVAVQTLEMVKNQPITPGLLAQAQTELFRDARKQPQDLGRIRRYQVWIGPEDSRIEDSRFVPPPGDDRLVSAMDAWQEWIETPHDLPPVLRAAMAHYQFETLHPFGDGNGRIGRLFIVLYLLRSDALHYPALTVSPWFLKRRTEYQDQLFSVSATGDWNPWVMFFSQAVREQCMSLIVGANRLTEWLESSRAALNERHWTGAIHRLLEDLTEWPVVTISFAAKKYHVTQMTATRMIDHLVDVGILRELTGQTYGRRFGATGVMDIVEAI
ncbi:MAG TPA: Fic family protein [Acidimicrobiales bacterium]|nr:Fic family protein [Acidimicrobiales bacterium]